MKAIAHLLMKLLSPLAVLAALSGTALANTPGFDLQIAVPNAVHVGQPAIAQVSGHNPPPGSYTYLSWLEVDLLRPEAATTCPAGSAGQIATNTGGAILTIASREEANMTGAFTVPVGFTPLVSGPLVLCAYSVNEEGFAWASASYTVDVIGEPHPKPASTSGPRASRIGGRLVCDPGAWSGSPVSFDYRWVLDGRRTVAHARTLAITRGLRGHEVQCRVTASSMAGFATATSRRYLVRR